MSKKRQTINPGVRVGKFFTLNDLNLEIKMGREYIDSDIPASVFLHRIDRNKTKVHSLYGEAYANEKVTLPPVEILVKFNVSESDSEYIGNSLVAKQFAGDLTFTVYDLELEEKQVDIMRGDYVGLIDAHSKMRFYEVYENDKVNVSNNKTIAGIKAFYRTIKCKSVDKDVFAG